MQRSLQVSQVPRRESDAFTHVLCPVRREEQLASSSSTEGGVRSGAQKQDDVHERGAPEPASELAENEGEEEEEARAAKPLRDPRDPNAAERAIHEAHPFAIPFVVHRVSLGVAITRRTVQSSPRRERKARNPDGPLLCPTGRRD